MNTPSLHQFTDQHHTSIYDHSCAAPMLLILLRHVGCPFCRRTLQEVATRQKDIETQGIQIGLVFMDSEKRVRPLLSTFGLESVAHFHDPDQRLYQELGLRRASMRELFRYRVWSEGFQFGFKHGFSWPESDPFQLPGAFLIDQGYIVAGDWNLSPVNPPDFDRLIQEEPALPAKSA